jgi:hypothetical protein
LLANSSPDLGAPGKPAAFLPEQFLQSKSQGTCSARPMVALLKRIKEITMEYLILIAVVSMMALYALIIVGCLKQPEW